jgi:hypothetical protein
MARPVVFFRLNMPVSLEHISGINLKQRRCHRQATCAQSKRPVIWPTKSTIDELRCFGGRPRWFKLVRAVVYDASDLDMWKSSRVRSNEYVGGENEIAACASAA